MYCVHCGATDAVTFCAGCGQRQPVAEMQAKSETDFHGSDVLNSIPALPISSDSNLESAADWTQSNQYEVVLADPEARQRISEAGRTAAERRPKA